MTNYSKGSEWRKWDLHFHTPSSYDYKDNSTTNEMIINKFIEFNVSVVAITDHHNIDVDRINELKKLANDKVTILPGIELRSELGGSESVHFIGIFPENSDIETIWTKLQGSCNLTSSDITSKGNDKIYVPFIETAKLIKSLGGIVSIHAGVKTNSIETLKSLPVKQAIKEDLIEQIDIYEIGKVDDVQMYKDKVFPHISKRIPLVICSDNHDIKNYSIKENCWIKADPTFEGLKQIIYEPEERVYIGESPDIIQKVLDNRTKYIKSIKIQAKTGYDGKYGKWFDNIEIPINSELIAIIGNKGSGKSAISDIISLCGYYQNQDDFSFLKAKKFRDGKHAKSFEAILKWESGDEDPKGLDDNTSNGQLEKVKYLPQGYFERLTNEISSTKEFQKEIENVVFTHLEEDRKIGYLSFEELIESKKKNVEQEITLLKVELNSINDSIIKLENKLSNTYKGSIENKIKLKKEELVALIEPISVIDPNLDPIIADQNKSTLEEIGKINKVIETLDNLIVQKQKVKQNILIELNEIKNFKQEIAQKINEFRYFVEQKKTLCQKYNFTIDDIFEIKFNLKQIDTLIENRSIELTNIKIELGEEKSDSSENISLTKQLINAKEQLINEQNKLDTPLKKYQHYLADKKNWEGKRLKIQGNEDTPDTLLYLEKELKYIESQLQFDIELQRNNRIILTERIFDKKQDIILIYKSVKTKIDSIINDNVDLLHEYKININAALSLFPNFRDDFFRNINQGVAGTYYTKENGTAELNKIIAEIDFDDKESVVLFLNSIIESIHCDKRDRQNNTKRFLEDQVKNPLDLYNNLFSLDFLNYNYQLKQGDKNLDQLSPGEKGALLLIFYLLLDNNNIPLIIDQPEDNLDNNSVANILVPFIRKAKRKRQIILVTHNPNLAVVSDAEQIIYVNIDKQHDNEFTFKSGSIENREINECIVKVLEGAMPAFNKRKQKYYE